ncbi:hypothetical protein MLD38_010722 [Melastoma candidum]|uniref:Uncharacterized protein n=1 Tax=Melastoma candidum TaxID=119954 RepID=A0ACB9R1B7_9MYRT|nr:hypothetical protein MLD38_010722 [Melastoma candidum]
MKWESKDVMMGNTTSVIALWFLLWVAARGAPDTKFVGYHCNGWTQADSDYEATVTRVVQKLVMLMGDSGNDYLTHDTVGKSTCFGHALCVASLSPAECTSCWRAARNEQIVKCGFPVRLEVPGEEHNLAPSSLYKTTSSFSPPSFSSQTPPQSSSGSTTPPATVPGQHPVLLLLHYRAEGCLSAASLSSPIPDDTLLYRVEGRLSVPSLPSPPTFPASPPSATSTSVPITFLAPYQIQSSKATTSPASYPPPLATSADPLPPGELPDTAAGGNSSIFGNDSGGKGADKRKGKLSDPHESLTAQNHEMRLHEINTLEWDELVTDEPSNSRGTKGETWTVCSFEVQTVRNHCSIVGNDTSQTEAYPFGKSGGPTAPLGVQEDSITLGRNCLSTDAHFPMDFFRNDVSHGQESFQWWMNYIMTDSTNSEEDAAFETPNTSAFSKEDHRENSTAQDMIFTITEIGPSWGLSTENTRVSFLHFFFR